jgi:hypothetical protein
MKLPWSLSLRQPWEKLVTATSDSTSAAEAAVLASENTDAEAAAA